MTAEQKTYHGGCHCGAFTFDLTIPELKLVHDCNCGICTRKAYIWVFPGNSEYDFKIKKGSVDDLTSYSFAEGNMVHKFCPTCGTALLAKGGKNMPPKYELLMNVRCFEDVDIPSLEVKTFNGKALGDAYQPVKYDGPEPTGGAQGAKLYTGSCHCGSLTVVFKSPPLDETYPKFLGTCNCSYCGVNDNIWSFGKDDEIVLNGDAADMVEYKFGRHIVVKTFCKKCGVHMTNRANPDFTDEMKSKLDKAGKNFADIAKGFYNINLRVLDGVDLSKLKISKIDGKNEF